MTTQRDIDKGMVWTQSDMSADPREVFADGAAYARKDILQKLYKLCGTHDEVDILDALVEELEKP